MLFSCDYYDMGVVDAFSSGADLVGEIPHTGLWPSKFQPATITAEELHDVACKERDNLLSGSAFCFDDELGDEVWEQTMEEVASGHLVGPLELDSIPRHYPLGRRFAIHQGSKTRCVGDFSMSSVNSCVQTCEIPKPHTADSLAALCSYIMQMASYQFKSW